MLFCLFLCFLQLFAGLQANMMVGGWEEGKITPETEQILHSALAQAENYAADLPLVCADEILSLRQQVVAGMNYEFTIRGRPVNTAMENGSCAPSDSPTQVFSVRIWSQPWLNKTEITFIEEKPLDYALIDAWIISNDLNEYGDLKTTAYPGGTPLFDEATGESFSKYDYIKKQHPETPWNHQRTVLLTVISDGEKNEIDRWISANGLNKYGDQVGRMYLGGTPLFDEATGTSKDRYEYIVEKHPEKPWRSTSGISISSWIAAPILIGGVALGLVLLRKSRDPRGYNRLYNDATQ